MCTWKMFHRSDTNGQDIGETSIKLIQLAEGKPCFHGGRVNYRNSRLLRRRRARVSFIWIGATYISTHGVVTLMRMLSDSISNSSVINFEFRVFFIRQFSNRGNALRFVISTVFTVFYAWSGNHTIYAFHTLCLNECTCVYRLSSCEMMEQSSR